jgi:hypothetical protein
VAKFINWYKAFYGVNGQSFDPIVGVQNVENVI